MQVSRSERGQTLVLIVLAIVAMFGFAALAVDIGRVFAERRRAQSAADSAALAAAISQERGVNWAAAALSQAALNDYLDNNPNANPDQPMDVQVYHPPISGPYSASATPLIEDYQEYYQVIIRSEVDPIFAHFIFSGLLSQTVESVARAQPFEYVYSGDAIVATNASACKAVWFQGSAGTTINGGNIFSNSVAAGNPSSCDSGVQNGSGAVTVNSGSINTVGTFDSATGVTASDGIHQFVSQKPLPPVGIPDCSINSGFEAREFNKDNSGTTVLLPGFYEDGIKVTGGDVEMISGMYCLRDNFDMNGGKIKDIPDPVTGRKGVFIVMLDGNFNTSGNVEVNLNRMNAFTDNSDQDWHGMLLYMPADNDGTIHMGGTGNTKYSGTILAPGETSSSYKCEIEGNSGSIGLSSNVICNTVKITGSATIKINYRPEQNWSVRPSVELSQ